MSLNKKLANNQYKKVASGNIDPSEVNRLDVEINGVKQDLQPSVFEAYQYFINQAGWHLSTSVTVLGNSNYLITNGRIIGVRDLTTNEIAILNANIIKNNHAYRWWTNDPSFDDFDGKLLSLVYSKQ